jgi:hypothetical protein
MKLRRARACETGGNDELDSLFAQRGIESQRGTRRDHTRSHNHRTLDTKEMNTALSQL